MNRALRSEYRRVRSLGWTAKEALRAARINTRFEDVAIVSDAVRFRPVEDSCPYDNYSDDMTDRDRKALDARIEAEGITGIISEVLCPCCKKWEHVDSVWGFVGDDWRDSGYDTDLKEAALDAYDARRARGV